LTSPHRPTAIFAAADFLALAALKAARKGGLSVPRDLSVVVFDDNLLVQHADPPLTAVSQPNWRLGEEAAGMLLEQLTGPNHAQVQRLIVPTLIVRDSTAPPVSPAD
jgi:LacI family transcriptional regulator